MTMRGGLTLAAGILAGLWIDTLRRTARADREHPPQGDFVDANGVRLHVMERGRGSPVVFFHGNGTLADDFAMSGVLDAVGQRHRAIAIDRPGTGHSERPWGSMTPSQQAHILHDGIVALNASKPVIVGHSLGAAVALAYALEFPHEVGGVVFLAGQCYPGPRFDFLPFMVPAIPVVGQVMSRTVLQPIDRALLPGLLARIFEPNPVPESYKRLPADVLLRPSQLDANAADLSALIPALATMAPRYPEISCPLAILAGEEDRIVDPHTNAARLHRDVRGSTLHLLAGTGHMVHHARPEAVISAIESVLRDAQMDAMQEQQEVG